MDMFRVMDGSRLEWSRLKISDEEDEGEREDDAEGRGTLDGAGA